MTFDVYMTICIRVKAPDINKAENLAMDVLDDYVLGELTEKPNVVQASYTMDANNPKSVRVKGKRAG